jgi:peptidylprolyl isomerase domain and WD repeat-containing protein 1
MADQDPSVLGKRVHDEPPHKPEDGVAPGPAEEDDDDDDIGPMPMPADASSSAGARKKRKGRSSILILVAPFFDNNSVLPHEKLYLELLPAADRYFKSFMHRDAIHFNIITK